MYFGAMLGTPSDAYEPSQPFELATLRQEQVKRLLCMHHGTRASSLLVGVAVTTVLWEEGQVPVTDS